VDQERKRLFAEYGRTSNTKQVVKVPFRGHTESFPVVRVKTSDLRYNTRLGRLILDRLNAIDVEGDPEEEETQKEIERKILSLRDTPELVQDLKQYGQLQPGLITTDGYVVNGNRRLASLRTLEADTGDQLFRYMEVGVLPEATPEELFLIETYFQMTPETRARYGPVTTAVQVRRGLDDLHLPKEVVAKAMNIEEQVLQETLDILELIDGYLAYSGRPRQYALVESRPDGDPEAKQGKWNIFVDIYALQKQYRTDPRWENFLDYLFLEVANGATMDDVRKFKKWRKMDGLGIFSREVERTAKAVLGDAPQKKAKGSGDKQINALGSAVEGVRKATEGGRDTSLIKPDPNKQEVWKKITKTAVAETSDSIGNLQEKEMPISLLRQSLKKLESVDFPAALKAAKKHGKKNIDVREARGLLENLAKRLTVLSNELKKLAR
jgi:hypothetical protein